MQPHRNLPQYRDFRHFRAAFECSIRADIDGDDRAAQLFAHDINRKIIDRGSVHVDLMLCEYRR